MNPRRSLLCLLLVWSGMGVVGDERVSPLSVDPAGESHWSHLPVWGDEARRRGYDIPLPFGIGFSAYHEDQPFNVTDLEVSIGGRDILSINRFVEVDQIETRQNNYSARLDAWLFPFLNVYGLFGYTSGNMKGTLFVPEVSVGPVVIVPETTLPLDLSYDGPTYGGGVTLAGGTRIAQQNDLTLFVAADANYTRTPLNFENGGVETDSAMTAWIASIRLGIRSKLNERVYGAIWAGSMIQYVDQALEGRLPVQDIRFAVTEESEAPANALLGMRLEVGSHWDFLVEAGLGTRTSVMGSLGFRF